MSSSNVSTADRRHELRARRQRRSVRDVLFMSLARSVNARVSIERSFIRRRDHSRRDDASTVALQPVALRQFVGRRRLVTLLSSAILINASVARADNGAITAALKARERSEATARAIERVGTSDAEELGRCRRLALAGCVDDDDDDDGRFRASRTHLCVQRLILFTSIAVS